MTGRGEESITRGEESTARGEKWMTGGEESTTRGETCKKEAAAFDKWEAIGTEGNFILLDIQKGKS